MEIFETFTELELERKTPSGNRDTGEEFLWLNSLLQADGNTVYDLYWIQKGITKIKDLWNKEAKRLYTVRELLSKINPNANHYHQVRITETYQKFINDTELMVLAKELESGTESDGNENVYQPTLQSLFNIDFHFTAKGCYWKLFSLKFDKAMYSTVTELKNNLVEEERNKAEALNEEWWNKLNKSQVANKVKELQWRITHKATPTRDKLMRGM